VHFLFSDDTIPEKLRRIIKEQACLESHRQLQHQDFQRSKDKIIEQFDRDVAALSARRDNSLAINTVRYEPVLAESDGQMTTVARKMKLLNAQLRQWEHDVVSKVCSGAKTVAL
jgi:hypothetical protein